MFSPEDFIIRRQCTPFCEARCKYAGQHDKILVAVINCVDDRGYKKFTKTIAKFVKKGWKVDDPIEDPDTEFRYPLIHWATVLGNVLVLKWCVEKELDLNKRWGQRSETALHRLMVCGYSALRENSDNILKTFKKIVKLLKVLLESKDDNKDLPLHVAAKVLVERPLMSDSRFDRTYTEMLKILIRITCEVDTELLNCRNRDGNTVMHIVAQHDKSSEILALLIENGADCDIPNSEGLKPIDIARAKDATDIIGVLSKNEDDLGLEEIGDIDVIYIESDDDSPDKKNNSNDEKDDAYIRNLLERVKSEPDDGMDEPEDGNDPDWNLDNSTNLDASTSNETLYTIDEDSFDIDGPFSSLSKEKSVLQRNNSAFDEISENKTSSSSSKKDKRPLSTEQTSNLKRKSSDKGTAQGPEVKKTKAATAQGKESKAVSPKLVIQLKLNIPKFKSLKRKITQATSRGEKAAKSVSSSPDSTTQIDSTGVKRQILTEPMNSDSEDSIVLATKVSVGEKSNQENEAETSQKQKQLSSPEIAGTLPGMCTDKMGQSQDQLMNCLPLSRIKEPLTTTKRVKHLFPSPNLAAELPNEDIPQSRNLSSTEEENSQSSFSSSAEIVSACQRLQKKLNSGSTNVNLSQLNQLFDILKPVETRAEEPVGRSTPNPEAIEQDGSFSSPLTTEQDPSTPSPLSMEQHPSGSSLSSTEQHRSSPSPVSIEQHQSNRSTPSPVSTEQHRSKKRIEDVISNLRERKQAGIRNSASRRESFESSSSTENNSIQDQVNAKQSDSSTEQPATTITSLQIKATKNDSTSSQVSNSTLEQQVAVESKSDQQEQASDSTSPVTNNNEVDGQRVLPPPEQDHGKITGIPQTSNSNIVIKKEVEGGGKVLDGSSASKQAQTTSSASVQSQAGNQRRASGHSKHDSNVVTKPVNKRPRIPRNALPTQVQAGSYRAMIPGGTSTSTDTSKRTSGNDAGTFTGTSGKTSGDNGETYQPLVSLTSAVEKLCEEANDPATSGTSVDKTDSNYDRLHSVIDQFCEEVFGISPGPQRSKEKQGEPPRQAEGSAQSNVTQGQGDVDSRSRGHEMVATLSQVQDQTTLLTQTQSTVQRQAQPVSEVKINVKQEPGVINSDTQNQGQYMALTHGQVLGTPITQTPDSVQVEGELQSTTQGQVVSTQSPLALLSETLPTQTQSTVQDQTQVPSLVAVQQQQPLQTLGKEQTTVQGQTLLSVQGQAQGQLPIQAATNGQQHIIQGYIPQPQPQPIQELVRLTQRPAQGQGTIRIQVPRFMAQGHVPAGENQAPRQAQSVLQQNQILAQVLASQQRLTTAAQANYFPVNQLSMNNGRRQVNPQNANVGIPTQNLTRPVPVGQPVRPRIPLGNSNMNQAVVWNTRNVTQLLRQQSPSTVTQNVNQPSTYIVPNNQARASNPTVQTFMIIRPANPQVRQPTLDQVKRYLQARSNNPQGHTNARQQMQRSILVEQQLQGPTQVPTNRPNLSQSNVQQTQASNQVQSSNPNISAHAQTFNGHLVPRRVIGPDMETAMANKISKDPTDRTAVSSATPVNVVNAELLVARSNVLQASGSGGVRDSSSEEEVCIIAASGSRSTTPQSNRTSPQPPSSTTPVDNQSQRPIQRIASVDNQSEQPIQPSGSDTTNPEESEDEGLGLNGFSEADNIKDLFKDMAGTKKVLEKLGQLVSKEDMRQLLEKAKIDRKENIDKWTNEYEAAARCERLKYLEFENLREKIEREQENARKLCENIMKWKKEAETVRKEKVEAAKKKTLYHNKIAEENEKIPMIGEYINMFTNMNENERSGE